MHRMALFALAVASALPLHAITYFGTAGCTSTQTITSTITFTGPAATDPAGHATYVTPAFNNGTNPCGSDFLAVTGTTTVNFDQPIDYFGFAWGTVDPTNTVQFFNGVTLLQTFVGTGVPNTYVNFLADPGQPFTSIVFSNNGGCCFETDNHSYHLAAAAVPEPNTSVPIALVGSGFTAWRIRQRRRKTPARC